MTITTSACPVCEEGVLTPVLFEDSFNHNGGEVSVHGLEGYRCSNCDAEPILPDQIRRNHVRISDAKRDASGLLSGTRIRAIREALGLSQQDAATVFGGGANGFSKYERGQTVQSIPMDRLLRVAGAYPWIVDFLRVQAGLPIAHGSGCYVDVTAVSLNDPLYTSKPVKGSEVISSESRESSVVSITDRIKRKAA